MTQRGIRGRMSNQIGYWVTGWPFHHISGWAKNYNTRSKYSTCASLCSTYFYWIHNRNKKFNVSNNLRRHIISFLQVCTIYMSYNLFGFTEELYMTPWCDPSWGSALRLNHKKGANPNLDKAVSKACRKYA